MIYGENSVTESPLIALEDTSEWTHLNYSPSGVTLGDAAAGDDVERIERLFPAHTDTKRYLYTGSLLDWEVAGSFDLSITANDTTTDSEVMAELFILSAYTPDLEDVFPEGEVDNPITEAEITGAVNYNMRIKANLSVKYNGVGSWIVTKKTGWDFGPRSIWNVDSWRDIDSSTGANNGASMSTNIKLKHTVPSTSLIDKTVGITGALRQDLLSLGFTNPAKYTEGGVTYNPSWDLDITQRPILRFGEDSPPGTLDIEDYRALTTKNILVNSFTRPPDFGYYYDWMDYKLDPYFVSLRYSLGMEPRNIAFTSSLGSFAENFGYKPKEEITFYHVPYVGTQKSYYLWFPHYLHNRLYLRVSRYSSVRECTASITSVNVKTAPPNTL